MNEVFRRSCGLEGGRQSHKLMVSRSKKALIGIFIFFCAWGRTKGNNRWLFILIPQGGADLPLDTWRLQRVWQTRKFLQRVTITVSPSSALAARGRNFWYSSSSLLCLCTKTILWLVAYTFNAGRGCGKPPLCSARRFAVFRTHSMHVLGMSYVSARCSSWGRYVKG